MAFGTSRIFKSTDVGAPQFNNAAGSLNAVLKAVLCTGYGSTPSLGWTVEFESGNVLVVRMKGGTRTFIQFDDSLTGSYTYVAAYSTMSSAFTGTERMPAAGQSNCYITKTNPSSKTTAIPWILVGDDAGFYLLTKPFYTGATTFSTNLWMPIYIGDYIPFDIRNKWNFCLLTSYDLGGVQRHIPSTTIPHYIQRSSEFVRGCVSVGIWALSSFFNTGGSAAQFGENFVYSDAGIGEYTINGVPFGMPLIIYAASYTYTYTSVAYGIVPGIKDVLGSCNIGTNLVPDTTHLFTIEVEFDGGSAMVLNLLTDVYSQSAFRYRSNGLFIVGEGFRNV